MDVSSWFDFLEVVHCETGDCKPMTLSSAHHATPSNMKRRFVNPRHASTSDEMDQQHQDMAQSWMKNSNSFENVDCEWSERYYHEHLSTSPCQSSPSTNPKPDVAFALDDHPSSDRAQSPTESDTNDRLPLSFAQKVEVVEIIENPSTIMACSLTKEKEVESCSNISRSSPDAVFDFPLIRQDDNVNDELVVPDTPHFLLSSPKSDPGSFECFSPIGITAVLPAVADHAVHDIPAYDSFSFYMDMAMGSRYHRLFSPIRNQSSKN